MTLVDITSSSVTLLWQPPPASAHNGIIRGYIVNVLKNATGTVTASYNVTDSVIFITGLHPYTLYDISIAALTTELGPFTSITSVLTNEAGK